jgi:MinD superfamily P-loop ATPase
MGWCRLECERMQEIVVLSGKGGTGKTVVTASFAALSQSKVLCDCDVDAADLHLLLRPTVLETHAFRGRPLAEIDPDKCSRCGLCLDICRFDAIRDFRVDPFACEGCRLCQQVCPEEAVTLRENLAGHWYVSDTRYGPLVHARLGPGKENSGELVAAVRARARKIAREQDAEYILSDGPPGIGCPVISSLSNASLALIVTEPSLSGIHDLERVLAVCRHFRVTSLVCINKHDLDENATRRIRHHCRRAGVEVAAMIPFDTAVTEAVVQGVPPVEYSDGLAARAVVQLWQDVVKGLSKEKRAHARV